QMIDGSQVVADNLRSEPRRPIPRTGPDLAFPQDSGEPCDHGWNRQAQAIVVLPGRDAPGDSGGGNPSGPLALLGRAASVAHCPRTHQGLPRGERRDRRACTARHPRGSLMPGTDHRKQSLYFPEEMLLEIQHEATRQDRSLSWIVQQAWKVARGDIQKMPSVNDVLAGR